MVIFGLMGLMVRLHGYNNSVIQFLFIQLSGFGLMDPSQLESISKVERNWKILIFLGHTGSKKTVVFLGRELFYHRPLYFYTRVGGGTVFVRVTNSKTRFWCNEKIFRSD